MDTNWKALDAGMAVLSVRNWILSRDCDAQFRPESAQCHELEGVVRAESARRHVGRSRRALRHSSATSQCSELWLAVLRVLWVSRYGRLKLDTVRMPRYSGYVLDKRWMAPGYRDSR